MDLKTLGATVSGIVVTAVVMWVIGTLDRGSQALTEDQIRRVLEETMVTDSGDTYGQALTNANNKLIVLETKMTIMEQAIRQLASE